MKKLVMSLIALSVCFSGAASAKLVGRWDPAAFAQGRYDVQKTAFVKAEVPREGIQIESKHILVKVDYTGKVFRKDTAFAKK